MKNILLLLVLVTVLALPFTGCAQEKPGEVAWEVPIDNFTGQPHPQGDEVIVPEGDTFRLSLGSNPTTGFNWSEAAQISNAAVLKQVNHEYIAPDGSMPGASGKEVWEFQTLEKGEATVYLEYSRSWDGGEKAEWTYTVTVKVE